MRYAGDGLLHRCLRLLRTFHSIGRPSPDVLIVGMLWAPFDHVARCGQVERLDDGNKMETFWDHEKNRVMQVPEDVGATRRNRTGDLLITIPVLKKRLVKAKKQHEVTHASLTGRYIAVLKHPRNSPLNPA